MMTKTRKQLGGLLGLLKSVKETVHQPNEARLTSQGNDQEHYRFPGHAACVLRRRIPAFQQH